MLIIDTLTFIAMFAVALGFFAACGLFILGLCRFLGFNELERDYEDMVFGEPR